MLSNKSADIATNLGEILTDEGTSLVPKKSTLLDNLVQSIHNNNFNNQISFTETIGPLLVGASEGKTVVNEHGKEIYNPSEHDGYMDGVVTELRSHVNRYIAFSRGVVLNEVKFFVESATEELSNYKTGTAENFFEVSYYTLPSLFTDSIIVSEASNLGTGSVKHRDSDINLSSLTPESCKEYLLTGDPDEDERIVAWLGGVNGEPLAYINMEDYDTHRLGRIERLNLLAMKFLFYRNLVLRADLETGLGLVELKSRAASQRDYYGMEFMSALNKLMRSIDQGEVILNRPNDKFSVYSDRHMELVISEDNFGDLAINGGSIETIYGYAASTDFPNTGNDVQSLVDNNTRYLDIWKGTRSIYDRHLNSTMGSVFRNIISNVFQRCLGNEESEDYIEFCETNNTYADKVRKTGMDYISTLGSDDIERLEDVALNLVAGVKYAYTSSFYILHEMNKELARNPDSSPAEAVWIAIMEYLIDFLISQVDVVQ